MDTSIVNIENGASVTNNLVNAVPETTEHLDLGFRRTLINDGLLARKNRMSSCGKREKNTNTPSNGLDYGYMYHR